MKRMRLIPLALLIAITSCSEKKVEETKEEVYPVNVEQINMETVEQIYDFTATVQPYKKNLIGSAQPNRIKKIFVEVGDRVRKGQKLVEMDAVNRSQQKTQLETFERDYNRMKELYAVGGASKQQLDQAQAQYDVAKDAFSLLDENTDLVSPIDGIVTERNYDPGDVYNGQQSILTVMQIQPVKLLIHVSEQLYSKIKEGMPVDVKLDVYGEENFKGKVNLIYPTIDETTRTFTVEVLLPNANSKVRPGMFARVILPTEQVERIVVSDKAVVKQSGSNERFVYVLDGNNVKHTKVNIGRRLGDRYEIIDGLEAGQTVVINGTARLVDGSLVEVKQ